MHASFTIRPICKFIKFYSFIHIHLKNFDKTQSNIDASNRGMVAYEDGKNFLGGDRGGVEWGWSYAETGGDGIEIYGDGWGRVQFLSPCPSLIETNENQLRFNTTFDKRTT